jgi:vancomycin resistance protein YoaR
LAARARRRRRSRSRVAVLGVLVLALLGVLLGLAFAGSPTRLAEGVRIDGVDVGGMKMRDAQALLERQWRAVAHVPVVFTAGGRSFRVTADELGVEADWRAAVEDARRQGEGFGPFRGFRRLDVRFFGADVVPATRVYRGALTYELSRIAAAVDRPHREASIRLRGLVPVVVPAATGRVLDRRAAAGVVVRALASVSRGDGPVALPVAVDTPTVTAARLAPALAQARLAVSAPVRLALADRRFLIPRWRIAQLLELPADGRTSLRVGGAAADEWLGALGRTVEHPPQDADFVPTSTGVRVIPDKPGVVLDAERTAQALLRAALRTANRVAIVRVRTQPAQLTVARAKRMGLVGLVSSYTTVYGGDPNRIHNVQLVADLIDR